MDFSLSGIIFLLSQAIAWLLLNPLNVIFIMGIWLVLDWIFKKYFKKEEKKDDK
jgi:hypothetical protein